MSTLTLPVSHFRLHDIAHSGQVFRWQPMGPDGYLLLSGRRAALARQPPCRIKRGAGSYPGNR